jgi:hypothetical protein
MTTYIRKEEFDTVELDDEWIILNMEAYTVTTLNEVGGFCWKLLREKQTTTTIVQAIEQEYATEESIQKDIEVFLSTLVQCGLLKYVH